MAKEYLVFFYHVYALTHMKCAVESKKNDNNIFSSIVRKALKDETFLGICGI